ncbi:hypothetical protein MKJ04_00860 [Pontibacter sp. E15-1]|uniref:hypothetical protein n=1 Tax=Pontibacter sp. E15-1 TaxID=2919918 RepID=UPI001F4F39C1|nr:hypothetical protein [Pontibacter sp. E15-1]MCJ8163372.1 hypothetical protein [Pontibacter sp. E15-1]
MRNAILVTFVILVIGATACQPEASVQTVMDNEAQRKEVYNMILDNDEMHQEMMQTMRDKNMGDMMGDGGMMGKGRMMGDSAGMMAGMDKSQMQMMMQKMMDDCAKDTANCTMMSGMMMQHGSMMQHMMQQMRKKGMMDEGCYQKMMSNMSQMKK